MADIGVVETVVRVKKLHLPAVHGEDRKPSRYTLTPSLFPAAETPSSPGSDEFYRGGRDGCHGDFVAGALHPLAGGGLRGLRADRRGDFLEVGGGSGLEGHRSPGAEQK